MGDAPTSDERQPGAADGESESSRESEDRRASDSDGEGSENDPRIEKIEAWIEELRGRREALLRDRARLAWGWLLPLGLAVGSLVFSGVLMAVWLAGTAATLVGTAYYMIMMYRFDYARQIERAREDVRRIKRGVAEPVRVTSGDAAPAADPVRSKYDAYRAPRQAMWGSSAPRDSRK